MIYECENCEATLGPGLIACPRCGQVFDEPVPDDALWDELVLVGLLEEATAPPRLSVRRKPRWGMRLAALLLLLGLCRLGYLHWRTSAVPTPAPAMPAPLPPTDLAAHPQYAAHMTDFVQKLRAAGVGVKWPAFGSNDVLLITPQARAAEPPVAWDADMDRRLAQGLYGEFVQTRHESGFPDTDAMACFVLVTSASGQVVAVDFMGDLK